MLYLSQLLGAPVEDPQGERIGKIIDIELTRSISTLSESTSATITMSNAPSLPILVIEGQSEHTWYVPVEDVDWHDDILRLRVPTLQLSTQPLTSSVGDQLIVAISLAQDVLDKQVIDIVRKKAVRVNDVCLRDDWHILGIDSSTLGLVRRLAPNWLLGTRRGSVNRSQRPPTNLILWENIELISSHQLDLIEVPENDQHVKESHEDVTEDIPLNKLKGIQSGQLAELHPADIADIVHQLTPAQGAREESEDVQELLTYEEDSAGGIMTKDYIVVTATKIVAEALEAVRISINEQDVRPTYVYCVADDLQDESKLLGVVSIWDLLVAPSTQPLQEFMETDLITVQPDTEPRMVAEIMAKYNLLAVPVVNVEGILEGVVTVDDALDILLPNERRRKPTRMY